MKTEMKKLFLPAFGVALVAGLTLVCGIIHGRMSNRWGPSPDTLAAAEKLKEFPNQFGSWRLHSSETMSDTAVEMLEPVGYISGWYVNQQTDEFISMTVILAPLGPLGGHTPEGCLGCKGYTVLKERQRVTIQGSDGSDHEFWTAAVQSSGPDTKMLRLYYAFSTGDRWSAPARPRFTLAGHIYVYKVLLSCNASNASPGTNPETGDSCRKFLQDFIPAAKHYLIQFSGG